MSTTPETCAHVPPPGPSLTCFPAVTTTTTLADVGKNAFTQRCQQAAEILMVAGSQRRRMEGELFRTSKMRQWLTTTRDFSPFPRSVLGKEGILASAWRASF